MPAVVCATEDEVLATFRQQEGRVAIKAVVPRLLHKSGAGGVDTDLVADRSRRLVPLTDRDAAEMLHDLRASSRLFGERAEAPWDTGGLVDVLLRAVRMAELLPEVVEVDLNPVIVTSRGVHVPDARVRVQQREPDDPFLRRLRVWRWANPVIGPVFQRTTATGHGA